MPRESIPTSLLCAKIVDETGEAPRGGHQKIRQLCLDGKLPGAHQVNGRWRVWTDVVPEIIAVLNGEKITA